MGFLDFLTGSVAKKRLGPTQVDERMEGLLGDISGPNYGYDRFERLMSRGDVPVTNYMRQGVSAEQARMQQRMQARQSQGAGYDAFRDFQGDLLDNRMGLLGMLGDREQFRTRMDWEREQSRAKSRGSFLNNIIGVAGGALGAHLGRG